jgi:hypothetical protein
MAKKCMTLVQHTKTLTVNTMYTVNRHGALRHVTSVCIRLGCLGTWNFTFVTIRYISICSPRGKYVFEADQACIL